MASRGRILSPAQKAFLAAAVAVLAFGVWTRLRPLGLEAAVGVLTDGDPDRAERLRAVRVVLEQGLTREDRHGQVLAAMAAVVLGDRGALAAASRRLGPPAPERIVPPGGVVDEVALGEPVLEQLVRAMVAEDRGEMGVAREGYGRSVVAAEMWDMPLAGWLAGVGLDRVE